jgi:hypothetical protein
MVFRVWFEYIFLLAAGLFNLVMSAFAPKEHGVYSKSSRMMKQAPKETLFYANNHAAPSELQSHCVIAFYKHDAPSELS